jgi:hypothetical protein
MRTAICGSRVPKKKKVAARRTGRLIPVTVGDLAASLNWLVRGSLANPRGEARWG